MRSQLAACTLAIASKIIGMGVNSSWAGMQSPQFPVPPTTPTPPARLARRSLATLSTKISVSHKAKVKP